ncbi:RND efflux system, outer membrane lipoprotein, NodT [Salinisphaera sp. PC39]|uniref:efflux transporter outer membrane subunit n=1 Tax=Salinisphaera sp. PC39 TaxID=1304156 RepID=UPI0033403B21
MRLRHLALPFLLAALAGCTLAPDYRRPASPVPADWPDGPAYAATGDDTEAGDTLPPAEIGWREFFAGDPVLIELIERSLGGNRDLRAAVLDVQRVRAQYRIQRAALLPRIDANAGYTRQEQPATGGGVGETEYYEVNAGVSGYELDLFGRVRSLERQALYEYLSTYEARRSAQIALIAEVADTYLTLLADRALLRLSESTLENRRRSLALIRRRFESGIGSELDVQQARTTVETARADRARYRRLVAQDLNALRLLVGGELPAGLSRERTLADLDLSLTVPAGLDSRLLLRRPDVRGAERTLQAANARIGAARAAFFPTISLTGSYGTLSGDLDGLFESGSEAWRFTPGISLPIFDAGERRANLDVAELRKRIEIANYEDAIQSAFREVADALAARGTLDEQLDAQAERARAADAGLRLSRKRYDAGIENYLTVLDSQRTVYTARQDVIDSRRAVLGNRIELYRALGGGWREVTASARPVAAGD